MRNIQRYTKDIWEKGITQIENYIMPIFPFCRLPFNARKSFDHGSCSPGSYTSVCFLLLLNI